MSRMFVCRSGMSQARMSRIGVGVRVSRDQQDDVIERMQAERRRRADTWLHVVEGYEDPEVRCHLLDVLGVDWHARLKC